MSKSDDTLKDKEKTPKVKSPVQIASEAINANIDPLPDALPSISLEGITPNQVVDAAQDAMIKNAFSRLQKNVVDGALAQSERFKVEEESRLQSEKLKTVGSLSQVPSPVIGSSGGLLNPMVGTDRAAMLDAALKNLSTDEAKLEFIKDHPELLSTSPLPFPGVSRPQIPVAQPVGVQQGVDMISNMREMSDMLRSQMLAGMEIQKAITPPSQNQQPAVDVLKVTETFKSIAADMSKSYSDILATVQAQNKAVLESNQKALNDSQAKTIELQMALVQKDKEYMQAQMAQMQEALRTPPQVPLHQLKDMIEQAKAGGVPVTIDTPDQERIRAEINREDKKLDHVIDLENRRIELELIKEQRRKDITSKTGSLLAGIFESAVLKKHQLSPAAQSVASRF